MKDILQEIIENKKEEIARRKEVFSIDLLESNCEEFQRKSFSMSNSIRESQSGIIAEFKRRSPSKGWINEKADLLQITKDYQLNGASALSILTDNKYFGGKLEDIKAVRDSIDIPILRKEFIIDEYQLFQAKLIGADAVLLIAAALEKKRFMELSDLAHQLGMEVLLEIHSEKEMDYIDDNVEMIGVNNRNLGTFVTDVKNSVAMIEKLPKDRVLVSESGISSPSTIKMLKEKGFNGFLIGECFMREENPGDAFAKFIKELC
jgi:indole-3-glycerol phosphate synthase